MKTKVSFSLGIPAILFTLLMPTSVFAGWYWVSMPSNPSTGYFIEGPNTIGDTSDSREVRTTTAIGFSIITAVQTPIPDGFMVVMKLTEDSKDCTDSLDSALSKLREYDSENEIVSSVKSSELINEESYEGRKKLLSKILDDTEECLEAEQVQQEKERRETEEERFRIEAEEARIVEVQKAVSECDFDYFENEMTNDERMGTWNEREACKNKVTKAGTEIVDESITDTEPVQVTPITPEVTYIPTPIPTSEVMKPKEETAKIEPIETQIADTSSEPATTSTETSTTTQEISKRVEQAEIDQKDQPEQQEKPSIFRRIVNFFASWFN